MRVCFRVVFLRLATKFSVTRVEFTLIARSAPFNWTSHATPGCEIDPDRPDRGEDARTRVIFSSADPRA